jgi:hypothetical protein
LLLEVTFHNLSQQICSETPFHHSLTTYLEWMDHLLILTRSLPHYSYSYFLSILQVVLCPFFLRFSLSYMTTTKYTWFIQIHPSIHPSS